MCRDNGAYHDKIISLGTLFWLYFVAHNEILKWLSSYVTKHNTADVALYLVK